ncbi:MAG: RNA polymerase subunit sigma-70 [Proteobacteria bacterium]|nr:MAG: RNA polymerase subunit sigma-70 [Pseudomonadota bacterium]
MTAPEPPRDEQGLLERTLGEMRPRLHRYCARMTGSVIDGEDVVQDAIVKALDAYPTAGPVADLAAWLFRITHNAALDFLRRRVRIDATRSNEDLDTMIDAANSIEARQIAATSLATFMRLTVPQRSSVILMDVLGYSLDEIGRMTGLTIPAIKAALHRGRARLREIAVEPDAVEHPSLPEPDRSLLASYVDGFNARDFDAIRDMLAEEVRLELVGRTHMAGKTEIGGRYFHNYGLAHDWHLVPAIVDGRPALVVRDPADPAGTPTYFVLLEWLDGRVTAIRDFRHARYVLDGAAVCTFP